MESIYLKIAEYATDYILEKLREEEFKASVISFLKEKAANSETVFDDAAVALFEAAWTDSVVAMVESYVKENF